MSPNQWFDSQNQTLLLILKTFPGEKNAFPAPLWDDRDDPQMSNWSLAEYIYILYIYTYVYCV
jgi:hypothetical protein